MRRIAFLFPGQGSQAVGMGRDAAARSPQAAAMFSAADRILGIPLSQICFEGPEEALKPTEVTQPALYTTSAATLMSLRAAQIEPWAVAGHSLGEYSALYAAGVFDFAKGLKLVRERGLAMGDAGSAQPGAMAAVLGLDSATVTSICAEVSSRKGMIVVAANFNDPQQTVISGTPAAVMKACELAKTAGAKRALPLPVSGAFHSPIVAPAGAVMQGVLSKVKLSASRCLFVNNADATLLADPAQIADSLVRQIASPVRWVASVERLLREGVDTFVEVGCGKVLSGLVRRIAKDVPCHTTESAAAIDATLAALKK